MPGKSKESSKSSDNVMQKRKFCESCYALFKSRSNEFKKVFNDIIPREEQLVVDYSCSLLTDVLVEGRLFLSEKYLCFFSDNIRSTIMVVLKWEQITSIAKENGWPNKSNSILIFSDSEEYCFKSLNFLYNNAYYILFKLWKNTLLDEALSKLDIWNSVHDCIVENTSFKSDKKEKNKSSYEVVKSLNSENYTLKKDKLNNFGSVKYINKLSDDSKSKPVKIELNADDTLPNGAEFIKESHANSVNLNNNSIMGDLQPEKQVLCSGAHEGRQLLNMTLPMTCEDAFHLLFEENDFILNFQKIRKNTDLIFKNWEVDPSLNKKVRRLSLTVSISQPIGPKTSHVTETSVINSYIPGKLYEIDSESQNAGVPYADSFVIASHFCIIKNAKSPNECFYRVYAQIKYKKSVWGLIKNFIEKNCWNGLEEYYNDLVKELTAEINRMNSKNHSETKEENQKPQENEERVVKIIKNSSKIAVPLNLETINEMSNRVNISASNNNNNNSGQTRSTMEYMNWAIIISLLFLFLINIFLYIKLWSLEGLSNDKTTLDLYFKRNTPKNSEEWLNVLRAQENIFRNNLKNWNQHIKITTDLLNQAEESIKKLENSINNIIHEQLLSIMKDSTNAEDTIVSDENNNNFYDKVEL